MSSELTATAPAWGVITDCTGGPYAEPGVCHTDGRVVQDWIEACIQLNKLEQSTLSALQQSITAWAIRKGWLNPDQPRSVELLLTLINTEMSELFEAIRKGTHTYPCDKDCGLTQFEEEMADIAIRVIQMAGEYKIDLAEVIERKMAYNEKRPYMHGKKL